jgi:hypothetical protein
MSISKINGETIIAAFGGGYSLRGTLANAAFNPSGGFTYYGGGAVNTTNTTTVNTRRIYIPKSGTIKSCYGFFNQIVSASANTGILYIRLNNMDDYQVGSLQAHNVNPTIYYSTTLNIAVTQGNYIEFKWTCPSTAPSTPPTDVTTSFIIYIE